MPPCTTTQAIEEYDWDFYQQMLDFFVKSPYLLARRLLPGMKERKCGRLINITSEFSCLVSHHFQHTLQPKAVRRGGHAVWQIYAPMASRSIWWLLAGSNRTAQRRPQEDKDGYVQTVPMGRWGKPDDVGWAVTYFASDEAAFVTGQTIAVNGGKTVW